MATRHPNHRLVKVHLSYTVEEAACLLGAHKNTVRRWMKAGLETIDQRRPALIQGWVLKAFLQERRRRNKQSCRPGEAYCMRCRAPRCLKHGSASYEPTTPDLGNLTGHCVECGTRLFRRVSRAKLAEVAGQLQVSMPKAPEHIDKSFRPSVNGDFKHTGLTQDEAQRQDGVL